MKRIPTMASVMTAFPYSIDVGESASAAEAALRKHAIRHLPVTDGVTLVGVVSERDLALVRASRSSTAEPTVNDACVREVLIVDLGEPLDETLLQMAEGHFDSALVVRRGKLAGIFTVTDVCQHFCEFLRDEVRRSGGDDAA